MFVCDVRTNRYTRAHHLNSFRGHKPSDNTTTRYGTDTIQLRRKFSYSKGDVTSNWLSKQCHFWLVGIHSNVYFCTTESDNRLFLHRVTFTAYIFGGGISNSQMNSSILFWTHFSCARMWMCQCVLYILGSRAVVYSITRTRYDSETNVFKFTTYWKWRLKRAILTFWSPPHPHTARSKICCPSHWHRHRP